MNLKIFFVLIISCTFLIDAQEIDSKKLNLTGSLYSDSKILLEQYEQIPLVKMNDDIVSRKSPVLAGLLSAALPGAGQFYNEDYWKAAIFVALEGALITTAVIYNNKGDEQNANFEAYADKNWSVVRYANWTIDNLQNSESVIYDPDFNPNDYHVITNGIIDWNELNRLERSVGYGYSHTLPQHGEQQYYEEIGKYPQFSSGWNDFYGGGDYHVVSPNFLYYADERGKANDYYNIGDKLVLGVIVNHAISVVEAILGANSFNKDLSVKFRVDDVHLTFQHELVPTLMVRYNF